MEKKLNPISLREIIIGLSIAVIMLIFGAIFDFDLSKNVYDPVNTSIYGIIFSGIAELPVCFLLGFSGTSMIIATRKHEAKIVRVFGIIVGIIAIGFGLYYVYDTMQDIASFNQTVNLKTLMIAIGIVFSIAFMGLTCFITFKLTKDYDKKALLLFSIYGLTLILLIVIFSTGGKFIWSRPRPRYIFTQDDPSQYFHNVFTLTPFECLHVSPSDNLKSFPSGHTTYASTAMFVLPYLTLFNEKHCNNKKIQIVLFYIGLLWALLSAFSRVFAGAHFLSDVSAGMIITLSMGLVTNRLLFRNRENKEAISNTL